MRVRDWLSVKTSHNIPRHVFILRTERGLQTGDRRRERERERERERDCNILLIGKKN